MTPAAGTLPGKVEQRSEHDARDPAAPQLGRDVHRLDLGVGTVELLERTDADERAVLVASSEERHCGVAQPVEVERVHVVRRRQRSHVSEVPFEQRDDVVPPGILDRHGDHLSSARTASIVSASSGPLSSR